MPDSSTLHDNWGRQIDYLRIAVTDRCNLRCFYCMPQEGVKYLPKKELLSYEEIIRLVHIFRDLGISKVRITGGEPFLRKGLIDFLAELKKIQGINSLNITTNGVLTEPYINQLKHVGVNSVNLSLDSLDKSNFEKITRRDEFDNVMNCLHRLLEAGIPTKINMVVMKGKNDHEVIKMAELSQDQPIDVRFIEEMPFNGSQSSQNDIINHRQILDMLQSKYPEMLTLNNRTSDPATLYQVHPYWKGSVGIIPAYSRTFCGACNRIRLTAVGTTKNCLYDQGVLDLRVLMRSGADDQSIRSAIVHSVKNKAKNGFDAENARVGQRVFGESMSTIGG